MRIHNFRIGDPFPIGMSGIAVRPELFPATETRRKGTAGVLFSRPNESNCPGGGKPTDKVAQLIKDLTNNDPEVRRNAIFSLERLQGKQALEPFIKCLSDQDEKVRAGAAFSLGWVQDKRVIEPLIKCLEDESESEKVRMGAAFSLARLQDKRAIEPLIKCLSDNSEKVRVSAASSLARLQDKRALELLIKFLSSESKGVRSYVASLLGELKDKKAVEPLVTLARSLLANGEFLSKQSKLCKRVVLSLYRIDEGSIAKLGFKDVDLMWLEVNKTLNILSDKDVF